MDDETGEYTLNKDVDYQILEQDYEDELTATQALNKEIEEAARTLVERMDDVDASGDETVEMPASADPEITAELTAKLPASGDAHRMRISTIRCHYSGTNGRDRRNVRGRNRRHDRNGVRTASIPRSRKLPN